MRRNRRSWTLELFTEQSELKLLVAGFSARGDQLPAISAAQTSRVELRADLTGDGDCDDANETVAYGADATQTTLTRSSGDGSPQPLISNLVPTAFALTYIDDNGC